MIASSDVDSIELFLGRPLPDLPHHATLAGQRKEERSVEGLRTLAAALSWGAVLELATSLLADHEDALEEAGGSSPSLLAAPGYLPPHLRLTCDAYRGLALIQTRMLDRAAAIVDALGSLGPGNPKYRYESYPECYLRHAPGTFVPFELSFLSIEVRVRRGDASAIADCYALKARFPQHAPFLLSALTGYHLRAAQHDAAADVARALAMQQGATPRALLVYARVLLHIGDIHEAARVLAQVNAGVAAKAEAGGDAVEAVEDAIRRVHCALLLAAQGQFEKALAENDTAGAIAGAAVKDGGEGGDEARYVCVFARCNAGICLMQMGRLNEAIGRLEDCLRGDCEAALDEGVVFNLCTMYDLAYPDEAANKKRVLHLLASRYGRQGFNLDVT
jgi:trafficking protein particle complex subunit 12